MIPGVSFKIDVNGLQAAIAKLNGDALHTYELMEGLGRLGQEQTRKRIESEKTTPAGRAWKPNKEGTSTLFSGGGVHLARSIDYSAGATEARWGSGWIGARVHQFGAVIVPVNAKTLVFTMKGKTVFAKKVTIPARTYVGLSVANEKEMIETAERFIGIIFQ
ncbi:MAG TPA: phage virion morphogenesis protein [Methylocystis sp.]|jgi:phage gpG-like protein